jgi:hypothetical protein
MSEYAINTETGRLIKKTTSKYKKLFKLGRVREIPVEDEPLPPPKPEPEVEPEAEFNERDLQKKLAEVSTDLIQKNLKKIVKSQKLSDDDMDLLIKKMLFKKLCGVEPKPEKKEKKPKKKVKKRFKVVSSESESESESD